MCLIAVSTKEIMFQLKKITPKLMFVAAAWLTGAMVSAQTAQITPGLEGGNAHIQAGPKGGTTPALPTNNNTAARAGVMMARTNGSRWRATRAAIATPDPGAPKLSQVSYFAVPEPEPQTLKKHDLVT